MIRYDDDADIFIGNDTHISTHALGTTAVHDLLYSTIPEIIGVSFAAIEDNEKLF